MTHSAHILLVDDDLQVVRFLKKALENEGYRVTATISGIDALQAIATDRPDLLILDLNMPEPDGFDVLREEREKFPYLRTIVISGYLEGALLEAAKIFGAVATLQKPVTPQALLAQVHAILG